MADATTERLLSLFATAGVLLGSPRLEDVLPGILAFAREFVQADGYAVWRLDSSPPRWYMASHAGVSDEFAAEIKTGRETAHAIVTGAGMEAK